LWFSDTLLAPARSSGFQPESSYFRHGRRPTETQRKQTCETSRRGFAIHSSFSTMWKVLTCNCDRLKNKSREEHSCKVHVNCNAMLPLLARVHKNRMILYLHRLTKGTVPCQPVFTAKYTVSGTHRNSNFLSTVTTFACSLSKKILFGSLPNCPIPW